MWSWEKGCLFVVPFAGEAGAVCIALRYNALEFYSTACSLQFLLRGAGCCLCGVALQSVVPGSVFVVPPHHWESECLKTVGVASK